MPPRALSIARQATRVQRAGISTVTSQTTPLASVNNDDILASINYPKAAAPKPPLPEPITEMQEMMAARARKQAVIDHFTNLGSTQTRENTFQPHHSLHRPVSPNSLTMSALMASGAHLGHAKPLLRPAFLPYAYGTRGGVTIIDLESTVPLLRRAANLVRGVAQNGGTVVFVGSLEALRPSVIKAVERMGRNAYCVASRWKPGTLTNPKQIFGEDVALENRTVPDLVIFLNPLDNLFAIKECAKKLVPTIGIIDSNVDPRIVMYPIPANDDSVQTAELIAGMLSMAGREGILALEQEEMRQEQEEKYYRRQQTNNSQYESS